MVASCRRLCESCFWVQAHIRLFRDCHT